MWHPKTVKFDKRLKNLFDEVNDYIEELYGHKYPLHPVRPGHRETSDPEADGLFDIGADFTPGFGSELGRGYVINLKIATLEKVNETNREKIYEAAVMKVKELLPIHFPERELTVNKEKNHYKIQGDFSLGNV